MDLIDAQPVLDELQALIDASATSPRNRTTAQQWHDDIAATRRFLAQRDHRIAFVGTVGVGKSSLIGVLAGLVLGEIKDRASLKDQSVLAVGSGRTTVCEVQIVKTPPEHAGQLGLVVEPLGTEQMKQEIEDYARGEWDRRHATNRHEPSDDALETAQEIHRFIRTMTGYAERQEVVLERGLRRARNVRPLDEVITRFDTWEALAEHLVAAANLPARTRGKEQPWWWTDDDDGRRELKRRFEAVNQGREPTTTLPRRLTVVVPDPLPGSTLDLELALIDTRGLDGGIESRRDLQDLLQDPRAMMVLCAPFVDAPGDAVRAVLRAMASDARLRPALERSILVLVDQGDAEQVNGAGGDRGFGQDIKIDECLFALERLALVPSLVRDQIVAFDSIEDERARLVALVDARFSELRSRHEARLREQLEDARSFLGGASDDVREEVDRQVGAAIAEHPLTGAPLEDALAGIYEAIEACRYASVVHATCRRRGHYPGLDAYAAVEARASQAATAWLDPPISAARRKLDELLADPRYRVVGDHVRRLGRELEIGQLAVVQDYVRGIGGQVEELLAADDVWQRCTEEWGRGSGFKARVVELLRAWSMRQHELTAHQRTTTSDKLAILRAIVPSSTPPAFTLWVRNLRALARVRWSPAPVSVLVGANGAGKSTLLQVLRLMRLAYERGLPESLRRMFPGERAGEAVVWDRPRKLAGATSHRLLADRAPHRTMLDLARAMFDEVGIGKRGDPADLVVVVDDVELGNVGQEGVVVECFRRAVLARLDEYEAGTRERYRALLRERCSFHLLKPMVESYLFGEPDALRRARVPHERRPCLRSSDVEEFETDDPDPSWRGICELENRRIGQKLPWWRHERHPKHYLEHLMRPLVYEETEHGKDALQQLSWGRVFSSTHETSVLRSLFEDIADWFEMDDNPVGAGACHEVVYPGRSVDRAKLLLRNV